LISADVSKNPGDFVARVGNALAPTFDEERFGVFRIIAILHDVCLQSAASSAAALCHCDLRNRRLRFDCQSSSQLRIAR
jgi:hypothetical protein